MKDLNLNSIQDLKREGKSFYWASFFLPRKSKEKAGILYSICRYFDNIADKDNRDMSLFLKDSIEKIKKNKDNVINVFLRNNNINILIFADLIDGLIADQKNIIIKNKDELINYSYHVAGTVGLMMSKIIGVKNNMAKSCAIDLGIAMQLTNIVRDVYEDAQMNRIYIPSEWIKDINLLMLSGKIEMNLQQEKKITNAIYRLINLSEKYYHNGFSGLKYIPIRTRLGILIAANIYRAIGTKIKKYEKKFLKKRVYLNSLEKTFITLKSMLIFIILPFMNYKYSQIRDPLPNENI